MEEKAIEDFDTDELIAELGNRHLYLSDREDLIELLDLGEPEQQFKVDTINDEMKLEVLQELYKTKTLNELNKLIN